MIKKIFPILISVLKSELHIRTNRDAGAKIGLSPAQVSQYERNPPKKEISWHKRIKEFWNVAYKRGFEDGRKSLTKVILDAVKQIYGISTQLGISQTFGVKQPTVGNWERGKTVPSLKQLQNLLDHRSKLRIIPIAEMQPIEPCRRGQTWRISAKKEERNEWKEYIENKKGIYLFYDSLGSATYIGRSKKCLLTEIEQRLGALLRGARYFLNLDISNTKKNRMVQGDIARMISIYQILDIDAIHNIEVLLIRALANNHLNNRLENFRR
jgi:transcriptional regulator with XRE-family HTH domain